MEKARVLSLLRKITQGRLRDVVEELLSQEEEIPAELISAIREKVTAGGILDPWTLGRLVIRTRDRGLFHASPGYALMLSTVDVACNLMRAGIPDKSIEQRLCERLADEFEHNRYGSRQTILETLRDFGTTSSLDTLEMIQYDFFPQRKTSETVLKGLPTEPSSVTFEDFAVRAPLKTDVFLGQLLDETVNAVRERNAIANDLWGLTIQRGDPFSRALKYVDSANRHLESNDLGASLNYLRKATEAMLKTVIELRGIKPDKEEPVEKLLLPALMAIVMDRRYGQSPEKTIYKQLEHLRDNTTYGSHDQGHMVESVFTSGMVKGQIEAFGRVLNYFRDYVDSAGTARKEV